MKPFNLEEALKGKLVITRSGREVKELKLFNCLSEYPLVGVINNVLETFTKSGEYNSELNTHYDLFMAEEKRYAALLWNKSTKEYEVGWVAETEEKAKKKSEYFTAPHNDHKFVKIIEFTI